MPFTPSHAVVALPFVRTPLVPAAIAIGAMTPDLPLFVRVLPVSYGMTHAFAWLPLTLILSLALLLLWRCALRPAARELSPRWLAVRLPREWDSGALDAVRRTFGITPDGSSRAAWRTVLLVVVSLAVGIASHILWDLFTHEGRWGSTAVPALAENWGPLPGFKWLQHGSSAVGLVVIGIWMLLWLVRRMPEPTASRVLPRWGRWVWWISLPFTLLIAAVWGYAVMGPFDSRFTVAHLAYRVLPPACALWAAATLVLCIAVQLRRRRAQA